MASEPVNASSGEGSKFKRFLRKFGKKPSDDGQGSGAGTVDGLPSQDESMKKSSGKSRGNSLIGGSNGGKKTSSNNITRSRNDSASQQQQQQQQQNKRDTMGFGGDSGQGLADTLVMPATSGATTSDVNGSSLAAPNSPPPQIGGLPSHEPINATEVANSSGALNGTSTGVETSNGVVDGSRLHGSTLDPAAVLAAGDGPSLATTDLASSQPTDQQASLQQAPTSNVGAGPDTSAAPALSVLSSSPAHSRAETSFDVDSTVGTRRRDSSDNRTTDTGKSTKPTTLMSLDGRDAAGNVSGSGMASIAQYRHGDAPAAGSGPGASPNATSSPASRAAPGAGSSSIQFASPPASSSRTPSAANVNLPGQNEAAEASPYVNVPSISRPHPHNNPTPGGFPADNASMLTLASSTAAQSIGGGAASSRGHYQTPSLGGARSIGGSLMGDRRNSSDTYASVKALPPQSRRGSNDSSRTGAESFVAPSAHSVGGANAMGTHHQGLSSGNLAGPAAGTAPFAAGPGAPADRIAMQRTNSQRTVATQLSIPLSTSASNTNLLQDGSGGGATPNKRSSTGSQHLLSAGGSTAKTPAEQVAAAGTSAVLVDGESTPDHQGDSTSSTSALPVPEITQTSPSPVPAEQTLAA